ncbi:thioesterase domain-containing protein [Streptomyces sp. NPDC047315]|uniref:thioesterase domain-containing protein n=1 Tax=Streptomyces sp. NPDC047315 TaxID=3155142 RepID=UPI0034035545
MTNEHALDLFDAALRSDEPLLMPAAIDLTGHTNTQNVPPLLHNLIRPTRRRGERSAAAGGPEALADRLARVPESDRGRLLLDLVTSQVATVLGHASGSSIEPDATFPEMGFDSLTAVELRNRLTAATGLRLPATLIFDHPTPTALAQHFRTCFDVHEGSSERAASTARTREATGLSELFVAACRQHRLKEVTLATQQLAAFRTQFTEDDRSGAAVETVRLGTGDEGPEVLCFPSFAWKPNPQQYLRLARGFNGHHSLSVLSLPGFEEGEPLPASASALAHALVDRLPEHADPGSYVLLGYSSGGFVASLVADLLAERGTPPAALVLIDTYHWNSTHGMASESWAAALPELLVAHNEDSNVLDVDGDAWVTARARYFDLDYRPTTPGVPTLLVRATEPLIASPGSDWQARWTGEYATADAPGDHFSLMEGENVDEVGRTIREWLASTL